MRIRIRETIKIRKKTTKRKKEEDRRRRKIYKMQAKRKNTKTTQKNWRHTFSLYTNIFKGYNNDKIMVKRIITRTTKNDHYHPGVLMGVFSYIFKCVFLLLFE